MLYWHKLRRKAKTTMVLLLSKPFRVFIGTAGALLCCALLIQDQTELSRVSDHLKESVIEESMASPVSIASNTRSGNSGFNSTIQLLLGDPEMMNRTVQAIALSPHEPGRLVAVVNVMALNCTSRLPYLENTGALVGIHIGSTLITSQPTQGVWIKDFHTNVNINIPLSAYEALRKKGNGVKVTVRDMVAGTDHTIPLLVDPSPRVFLSGLVWINKARRFYEGRKGDNKAKKRPDLDRRREAVGIRLGPAPRNDAYTLSHLLPWIQYHREHGVQHIYILDQENNLTQANFPLTPPFLTYIRAPYAFMDYFVDQCDPITHKVTNRLRHAVLQHILDSLVIRMTPSEWILINDLDEFMVPAPGSGTLPDLVQEFSNQHCQGLPWKKYYRNAMWEQWQNISCIETRKPVFELQFYQCKLSAKNQLSLSNDQDDFWALTKTIYHAPYVARARVHFAYPLHDSAVSTKMPPHRGFFAHFRNGAPSTSVLKKLPLHAHSLKRFSKEYAMQSFDDDTVLDIEAYYRKHPAPTGELSSKRPKNATTIPPTNNDAKPATQAEDGNKKKNDNANDDDDDNNKNENNNNNDDDDKQSKPDQDSQDNDDNKEQSKRN
jgi:Glycosyltransferase family 92